MYTNLLKVAAACFAVSLLFTLSAKAQSTGGKFTLFFEKVYLHTDRSYYVPGEDLWYKAYAVDAQTLLPAPNSLNAYVELVSPGGSVIERETIRLDKGEGWGDYKLDTSLAPGAYYLRAYTNWMRNFGNMFLFQKEICIGKTVKKGGGASAPGVQSKPYVGLFPEGGALVAGVQGRIAVKVADAAGHGLPAKGEILDNTGKTITTFQTDFRGMGMFGLLPVPGGVYRCKGVYPGGSFSEEVPAALEKGTALQVNEKDTVFEVVLNTNDATLQSMTDKRVLITARHSGKLYFDKTLEWESGQLLLGIPKRVLPEGITAVTVYDAQLRPHCERLVYAEKDSRAVMQLKTDNEAGAPEAKTTVTIDLKESDGTPVIAAGLSMAVTDASAPASETDIVSYLLLQSEVRGYVEHPETYLDRNNTQRFAQRDLLLCTQGWRDYLWRRVKDSSITLHYLPEPGITLSGHVQHAIGGKGMPGMNVTLMAPEARGNKIWFTKTDSTGAWYMDGLPLYGSQKISLTSRNDKAKSGGMLTLDSVGKNVPLQLSVPSFSVLIHDSAWMRFAGVAEKRQQLVMQQQRNASRMLESVTVKNTPKTATFRDGVYMSFGGPDSTFVITPADDKDYGTLENFILHRMPGSSGDADTPGVYFWTNGQKLRPRFKVNNVEDVFERVDYYTLPMSSVEQVTIRRMLGSTMNDAWFVYLTLKPEAFQRKQLDFLRTTINGYYEAREFYQPQPEVNNAVKDMRTTFFWKPDIKVVNGRATVQFTNAGYAAPVRVVVEGITAKGTPVATQLNYNIK